MSQTYINTKPPTLQTGNNDYNKIYAFANNVGWIYRHYHKFLPNGLPDKTSTYTDEVLTTIKNLSTKIPNDVNNKAFTSVEFFPKTIIGGVASEVLLVLHSDVPLAITGSPTVTVRDFPSTSSQSVVVNVISDIDEDDIVIQPETEGIGTVLFTALPTLIVSGSGSENFSVGSDIIDDTTGAVYGVTDVIPCKELTLGTAATGVNYTLGEIVTQAVSGATATVVFWSGITDKKLIVSDITGTFDETNNVTGATSGTVYPNTATANAAFLDLTDLPRVYQIGEIVTQETSLATGTVVGFTRETSELRIGNVTGTFNGTDIIEGTTTAIAYAALSTANASYTLTYSSTLSEPSIGLLVFRNASVTGAKGDILYVGGTGSVTLSGGSITNVGAAAALASLSLANSNVATLSVS